MNNSNTLVVSSEGRKYVLLNLNSQTISDLENDSNQLSEYFDRCLRSGIDICVQQNNPTFDAPSTSANAKIAQTQAKQPDSKKTSFVPARDVSSNVSSKQSSIISGTSTCGVNNNSNKRKTTVPLEKQVFSDEGISPTTVTAKKSKKAVKLTDEEQNLFDEVITTQVMGQPMLHNPRLKSNRFAGMKAEKWKEICDMLHEAFPNADNSIAKVKDRWAHIRDEYLKRQRLNKKGSGSGFTDIEDEPLDEMLSGLNDVYELKQTTSNIIEPERNTEERTFKSVTSKSIKIQENKTQDTAIQIIESSSQKFLSAIENIKESFVHKKEKEKENYIGQDKVAKFCDMIQSDLRELEDRLFRQAQIEILQVISKLKDS